MLKEKEFEILNSIASLRFLDTNQVYLLHGYGGKFGKDVTRKKLKYLEDQGFIKSWQPSAYEPKIYYLSKKGATEVSLFYAKEVETCTKSIQTLHHTLVSEIFVHLKLCKAGRIKRFDFKTHVGKVIPDAFVEFEMGPKTKLLFLEVDRCTERSAAIINKLDNYKDAFLTEEWQNEYGIFPDVVFITLSDERKRMLLRLKEQYPYRIRVFTLNEFLSLPASLVY